MSSSVIFGENSIFAKIDTFTSLGLDRKLDKMLGFGPGKATTQRIGELASQSAKEGGARPIVWGRVRPISGNIMHSSKPRIVRREVKGQSSGGKGGKKKAAKQYEERVFRTYAIRICEGPITGIIRVWRNNKLVYDARGNAWGEENNGVFLRLARFYLGGWDQMPDSALESIWGAGEVPGYRGTCYMVVPDEDLTDLGGAVPQYVFEVERAEGTYLTSKPYAVEETDGADGGISVQRLRDPFWMASEGPEELDGGIAVHGLVFRSSIIEYEEPAEELDGGIAVHGLVFRSSIIEYEEPAEELDGGIAVQGLVFRIGVITYQDPDGSENIDGGISVQGLSHGTA